MRSESEIAESRIKGMHGIPDGTVENMWELQVWEQDQRARQAHSDMLARAEREKAARRAPGPALGGQMDVPALGSFVNNGGFVGVALAVVVLFVQSNGGVAQWAAYLFSGYILGAIGGAVCYVAALVLRLALDVMRVLARVAVWLIVLWIAASLLTLA